MEVSKDGGSPKWVVFLWLIPLGSLPILGTFHMEVSDISGLPPKNHRVLMFGSSMKWRFPESWGYS